MGIFSRMRDIVSSNINAMLDRAEDPEKLIRLMIQEMEDTLVEVKASCAGAMAQGKRIERELGRVEGMARQWADRASLALDKGREDLAREALLEKRRWQERADALAFEAQEQRAVVDRYHEDIGQLEEKLAGVREKQRILVQRHMQARQKLKTREGLRHADSSDVLMRFAKFENRVERMEAEAELAGPAKKPGLDEAFDRLTLDEDVERELAEMKASRAGDAAGEKAQA